MPTLAELSTPLIADACVRLQIPLRIAPSGIHPVLPTSQIVGQVLPARHYGSVDVFLEALSHAGPGDILVIDNGGRRDEGCIGDLTVLEAEARQVAGLIVWGLHRDTVELRKIGLPVFSYGAYPAGPVRVDVAEPEALMSARFGGFWVTREDVVFADADGVIFVERGRVDQVAELAEAIFQTERRQAELVRSGKTLFEQLRFADYLAARANDPLVTFRQHLRRIGGAIEE